MSDYDYDRDRFRNRFNDEDFDTEGGYGRNRDYERGIYGRGTDYGRGYAGQDYGQNYGRYGRGRGQVNRGMGQDWDYNRGNYAGSYNRGYGSDFNYERGAYGRGMDRDYDQDYGQNYNQGYGRYSQSRGQFGRGMGQDWDYNRGYGRSSFSRGGYGYNRGSFQPDYDRDYDFDYDTDFGPFEYTYTEIWMIPGPETGRGPQGYKRSDERILEDVSDRLMQHGRIDASDMTVTVDNCEVTLEGTVHNRNAKRMAEDVAESVPGVTNVHNNLKVKQRERQGRTRMDQPHEEAVMGRGSGESGEMGQPREIGRTGGGPQPGTSTNVSKPGEVGEADPGESRPLR